MLSGHKGSPFLPNVLSSGTRKKGKIASGKIFCMIECSGRLARAVQGSENVSSLMPWYGKSCSCIPQKSCAA